MFGYDLMLYNEIENYQERIFAFIFILYMEILLVNKLSFNKFRKDYQSSFSDWLHFPHLIL